MAGERPIDDLSMLRSLSRSILALPFKGLGVDEAINVLIASRKVPFGQGHEQDEMPTYSHHAAVPAARCKSGFKERWNLVPRVTLPRFEDIAVALSFLPPRRFNGLVRRPVKILR